MSILLVTGTSTGVGKTVVTAALAAVAASRGRSVAVCKPAQTGIAAGEPGDLDDVVRLTGTQPVVELARYPDPLAPEAAARHSGLPELTLAQVATAARRLDADYDITLIEGAGGVLVGLGADSFTMIDLARELDAPMVVVAGAALGTLNHSALTVQALNIADVRCAGLVIGSWPAKPDLAARLNVDDLPRVTGVDLVGSVPEEVGCLDRATFTSAAPLWFDLDWSARELG